MEGSVVDSLTPGQPDAAAWRIVREAEPTLAAQTRAVTRWFLAGNQVDADVTDDAVSVISELVANACYAVSALPHGASRLVEVSWRVFPDRVLIEVGDGSPLFPVLRPPSPDALTGRGLTMVDALSNQQWGYFFFAGRKFVYAVLARLACAP